ncbi:Protein SCAI [Eumeta japonica]|uniref:Protein SCAI n=1 Tax=Eumeta variegata TaxID=151549 RepID=A0A4C1SCA3_EUMVA|nr:Protein SCAI [Eumeta japonica]
MVGMSVAMEDHERKIVIEFCHLLEKSKQLFNGLRMRTALSKVPYGSLNSVASTRDAPGTMLRRPGATHLGSPVLADLPQYGHKQWQSYFGRTFDVYTKLWKFQQQHRVTLDCKYGLKRWQIGEIASKIGQLYYHFYLRTSESAYLNEAYSFYYAIRGRAYYTRASKEDRCDLMVKKLRYYARFIVVCLLLKKMKLLRELITELDRQIIDYGNTYDPQDQMEWTVVVEEIKSFVHADSSVTVLHGDSNAITLTHRLNSQMIPPVEKSLMMNYALHEILIIGSCGNQVKFSELTMDMFRIIQTLEREPSDDIHHQHDGSPKSRGFSMTPGASCARDIEAPRPTNRGNSLLKCWDLSMSSSYGGFSTYPGYLEGGVRRENPHKYLLYKPSLNQVLVYLASGCKDLSPNGVLLLYISADGCLSTVKHPEDLGYDLGGVVTNSKRDPSRENYREGKKSLSFKEVHCLYPGDLEPFTRRPLFLIVESNNSFVFQNIPRRFGQPLVIFMSPLDLPQPYQVLCCGQLVYSTKTCWLVPVKDRTLTEQSKIIDATVAISLLSGSSGDTPLHYSTTPIHPTPSSPAISLLSSLKFKLSPASSACDISGVANVHGRSDLASLLVGLDEPQRCVVNAFPRRQTVVRVNAVLDSRGARS